MCNAIPKVLVSKESVFLNFLEKQEICKKTQGPRKCMVFRKWKTQNRHMRIIKMYVQECRRTEMNVRDQTFARGNLGHDQGGLWEPSTLLKQTISTCPKPLKPFWRFSYRPVKVQYMYHVCNLNLCAKCVHCSVVTSIVWPGEGTPSGWWWWHNACGSKCWVQ